MSPWRSPSRARNRPTTRHLSTSPCSMPAASGLSLSRSAAPRPPQLTDMPRTSVKDLGRSGFSLVETLLVIIVVVVIAAAGYLVYHHAHQKKHANASAKTAT